MLTSPLRAYLVFGGTREDLVSLTTGFWLIRRVVVARTAVMPRCSFSLEGKAESRFPDPTIGELTAEVGQLLRFVIERSPADLVVA
jgi:hypothetical protein